MATTVQSDLPDFHSPRQVTDDPLVNINTAVNVTPYDSGTLDLAVFTHVHVAATATSNSSVFLLKVTLHPDSAGAIIAFQDQIFLSGNPRTFSFDYPLTTRYAQFQVSELTATGGTVRLVVSPSSGPSRTFNYFLATATPSFQSVASSGTLTHDPLRIARGVWRVYANSRTPDWQLQVKARDNSGADTVLLNVTNGVFSLPFDQAIRFETASLYAVFTNQWSLAASVYLYMALVAD